MEYNGRVSCSLSQCSDRVLLYGYDFAARFVKWRRADLPSLRFSAKYAARYIATTGLSIIHGNGLPSITILHVHCCASHMTRGRRAAKSWKGALEIMAGYGRSRLEWPNESSSPGLGAVWEPTSFRAAGTGFGVYVCAVCGGMSRKICTCFSFFHSVCAIPILTSDYCSHTYTTILF